MGLSENKNEVEREASRLSVDAQADFNTIKAKLDTPFPDTEAFLREAFRKDAWLGCTLLFDHYYAPMCSHAVRYVYSKEYAEDVVADVFREFWQKKQFLKVTTSYRTYLFRAVRNRALNMIKREFHSTTPLQQTLNEPSKTLKPDEHMMYDQFYQSIQRCVDQLPPRCRKVFLMSRFENKSLSEIAMVMGISIRTAETHISKALSILRFAINQENL